MRAMRLASALVACGVWACGGAAPEPRAVVTAKPDARPAPIAEPAQEERHATVEYVVVPFVWVEKVAPAAAADVKAWGETPENKKAIATRAQEILFTDDADGRRRAERAVARLAKGDDFGKVARETALDLMLGCDGLASDVERVAAGLAPGEAVKAPVRSACAVLLVVKKDAAREDDVIAAFRKAKAPELAKKLADEILARMRTADSTRAAIAGAVEAVLGEDAKENAERPQAQMVVDDNIERVHLTPDARAALGELAKNGRTGTVAAAPIASKGAFVAARVAAAPPR